MSAMISWLQSAAAEHIGWMLVHSLWQLALLAGFYGIVRQVLRRASAAARYMSACAVMVCMVFVLPVTALLIADPGSTVAPKIAAEPMLVRAPATVLPPRGDSLLTEFQSPPTVAHPLPDLAVTASPVDSSVNWMERLKAGFKSALPWVVAVWIVGVLALAARQLGGWLVLRRLCGAGTEPADEVLVGKLRIIAERLGVQRAVRLLSSINVAVPSVIGHLKPVILLPASLITGLSTQQIEAILAHELAHVRRHDYLVNLIQVTCETVLFYHPAVWWITREIRREREHCCDDLAVQVCGDRIAYARTLATLEERRFAMPNTAMAATGGSLMQRIRRIVGQPADSKAPRGTWLAGMLAVPSICLLISLGVSAGTGAPDPFDFNYPLSAYEKGIKAADRNHRIKVDGLQFAASPLQWNQEGWLRLPQEEQGPGEELFLNLGVSDGYEIVEIRLFDHATRQLIHDSAWQHPEYHQQNRLFVERIGSSNWLRMKEAGGTFPNAIDVWLRIATTAPGKTVLLGAQDGASAKLGGSEIVVTSLLEGSMNGNGSGPDGAILWDLSTAHDQNRFTTVNLENRGDLLRGRYHLVAVTKDGARHPMDHTHFWDFGNMNRHAYFLMDVALADVDQFELVPFKDRQKFFFNGLEVPPKNESLSKESPKAAVRREHRSRQVATGRVIDSETGATVENFVIQDRLPMSPEYDGPPVFGGETRSDGGFRDGKFSIRASDTYENDKLVDEGRGECRLLADGYLPEHVVVPDDHPSGEVFVVRLRRGNMVRGRVLDHTGKPVIGAGIYLSNGQRVIELTEGPHSEFQESSVRTDENGRFEMSGGGAENKSIFVTAPSLFVWRADLPQPGQEAAIRLPEPAKLRIRYDIKGAPTKAQVRIELRTWDMPKWQGAVNVERWVDLAAGKDGVLIENLPPGVYDISRIKHLRTATSGNDAMLDRNLELTLESGKTTEYNFARPAGASISGEIVGLPDENVAGVFVYVKPAEASGDPRGRTDWKLPTFDGLSLDGNGEFTTERIAPGEYKIIATANRTENSEERVRSGLRLPAWVGSAIIAVPEAGDPPRVRMEMKPYPTRERATRDDKSTYTLDEILNALSERSSKYQAAPMRIEYIRTVNDVIGQAARTEENVLLTQWNNFREEARQVATRDETGQPTSRYLVGGERAVTGPADGAAGDRIQYLAHNTAHNIERTLWPHIHGPDAWFVNYLREVGQAGNLKIEMGRLVDGRNVTGEDPLTVTLVAGGLRLTLVPEWDWAIAEYLDMKASDFRRYGEFWFPTRLANHATMQDFQGSWMNFRDEIRVRSVSTSSEIPNETFQIPQPKRGDRVTVAYPIWDPQWENATVEPHKIRDAVRSEHTFTGSDALSVKDARIWEVSLHWRDAGRVQRALESRSGEEFAYGDANSALPFLSPDGSRIVWATYDPSKNRIVPVALLPEEASVEEAGFKFEAGFIPEKSEVMVGEAIYVTFYVRNTGNKALYLETGGDGRGVRSYRFQFSATDEQGDPARDPYPNPGHFGGLQGPTPEIKPGETYSEKLQFSKWIAFDRPGQYTVRGAHTLQFPRTQDFSRDYALVHPLATSFHLTVLPQTDQGLSSRIEALGRQLHAEENEGNARLTSQLLTHTGDTRAIPYLLWAANRWSGDSWALHDLTAFKDDPRVVALYREALTASRGNGRRSTAARLMGEGGNQAFLPDLLQAFDKEDDKFVLTSVATALGQLGDAQALPILKKHRDHTDPNLRLQVEQALVNCGEALDVERFQTMIRSTDPTWYSAAYFVSVNGGNAAARIIAECLNFEHPEAAVGESNADANPAWRNDMLLMYVAHPWLSGRRSTNEDHYRGASWISRASQGGQPDY